METAKKLTGTATSAGLQIVDSRYNESGISDAKAAVWGAIRYQVAQLSASVLGRDDGILVPSAISGGLQMAAQSSINEFGDESNAMIFASGFLQHAVSKVVHNRIAGGELQLPGQEAWARPSYTPDYNQSSSNTRGI